MKQGLCKVVALVLSASMTAGSFPASAWADEASNQSPADARDIFQRTGFPEKAIAQFFDAPGRLNETGRLIYKDLKPRDVNDGDRQLRDRGKWLGPLIKESMESHGGKLPQQLQSDVQDLKKKIAALPRADIAGTPEASYALSLQLMSILSGEKSASQKGTVGGLFTRRDDGGTTIYDEHNKPAFEVDADGRTTLIYALLERQRQLNRSPRPPGAPDWIPETGRMNKETIQRIYFDQKAKVDGLFSTLRQNKMRDYIQKLKYQGQVMQDTMTDALYEQLEKEARKEKIKDVGGGEVTIYEYVSNRHMELERDANEAAAALKKFAQSKDRMIAHIQKAGSLPASMNDAFVKQERVLETRVWNTTLTAYKNDVDSMRSSLNPTKSDYEGEYKESVKLLLDSDDKKIAAFEKTLTEKVLPLHDGVSAVIAHARAQVRSGDLSEKSLAAQIAAVLSADRAYQDFMADVRPVHQTLSSAKNLRDQVKPKMFFMMDKPAEWGRNLWAAVQGSNSNYARAMNSNEQDWSRMSRVLDALSAGNMGMARNEIINMHPYAADTLPSHVVLNDAARVDAAFREINANVALVTRTNSYINSAVNIGGVVAMMALPYTALARAVAGVGKLGEIYLYASTKINEVRMAWAARIPTSVRSTAAAVAGGLGRVPVLGWGMRNVAAPIGRTAWATARWAAASPGTIVREAGKSAAGSLGLLTAGSRIAPTFVGQAMAAVGHIGVRMIAGQASNVLASALFTVAEHYGHMKGSGLSVFDSYGSAFWEGAIGGATFMSQGFLPLVFFGGLPSTIFRGLPGVSRLADFVAYNALSGMAMGAGRAGFRLLFLGAAKLVRPFSADKAAVLIAKSNSARLLSAQELLNRPVPLVRPTFYDRLAKLGAAGRFASAFGMNVDHMLRFWVFQNLIVEKAGYYWGRDYGRWSDDPDIEERYKAAAMTERKWGESYWWLFIPQGSGHETAQGLGRMRAMQAAMEYKTEAEFLTALNSKTMRTTPRRWWEKILDPFPQPEAVDRDEGLNVYLHRGLLLAREKVKEAGQAHFMRFLQWTKVKVGDHEALGVKADADLIQTAQSLATESIIDPRNKKVVLEFLDKKNAGDKVGDYSVTPELQAEIAGCILTAESVLGREPSKELVAAAKKVLKDSVDSAEKMTEPAKVYHETVKRAASIGRSQKAEFARQIERIQAMVEEETPPDTTLTKERAQEVIGKIIRDGQFMPEVVSILEGIRSYIDGSYVRLHYANTVKSVDEKVSFIFGALKKQFRGNDDALTLIEKKWESTFNAWRQGKGEKDPADNMEEDVGANPYKQMLADLASELKQAQNLTDVDRMSLAGSLAEIGRAPWVVRDAMGTNIGGWRSEQFIGLTQLLSGYAGQQVSGSFGRPPVRIYQLMGTGTGKTLAQFIGLLPFAERVHMERGKDKIIFTTDDALKSQAVNDFVSFRVVGSRMEFSTPGQVKGKIAEEGMHGSRGYLTRNTFIMDEADKGLFEDPSASLGGLNGVITRFSSAFVQLKQRLDGLQTFLEIPEMMRFERLAAAARGVRDMAALLPDGDGRIGQANAGINAGLKELRLATRSTRSHAARQLQERVRQLREQVHSPREDLASAFGEVENALQNQADDKKFQDQSSARLKKSFREDLRSLALFGSREAPDREIAECLTRIAELRLALSNLEVAREHSARETYEAAKQEMLEEIAMLERFVPDAEHGRGRRMALLIRKDAEILAAHEADVAIAEGQRTELPEPPAILAALKHAIEAEETRAQSAGIDLTPYQLNAREYYQLGHELRKVEHEINQAGLRNAEELRRERIGVHRQLSARRQAAKDRMETEAQALAVTDTDVLSRLAAGVASAQPGAQYEAAVAAFRAEFGNRLASAQESLIKGVDTGQAGWQHRAATGLSAYRRALDGYAAEENGVYQVLRDLHEDAKSLVYSVDMHPTSEAEAQRMAAGLRTAVAGTSSHLGTALRLLLNSLFGRDVDVNVGEVGLERSYAARLLAAIQRDRGAPAAVKNDLFWPLVGSLLLPGRSRSWVHSELGSFMRGFKEKSDTVYTEDGAVLARFNGQVVASMDIDTRRFWELVHGADFTLRYEHLGLGGARDMLNNRDANLWFFSATVENAARDILRDAGVAITGVVVHPKILPQLRLFTADGQSFSYFGSHYQKQSSEQRYKTYRRDMLETIDDPELKARVDSYLGSKTIGPKDPAFDIDLRDAELNKLEYHGVGEWFRGQEAVKHQRALLSGFLPDTQSVRALKAYLIAHEGVPENQIAMIFSDAEYQKAHGDAEAIDREMNLEAMREGTATILLIDSSYVMRGKNVELKGARDKFINSLEGVGEEGFRGFAGYNHNTMIFMGVDQNTSMQVIQAVGRTSPRRALPGMTRDWHLTFDIRSAQYESAMSQIFSDPAFNELMEKYHAHSWAELNDAIQLLPANHIDRRVYEAVGEEPEVGKEPVGDGVVMKYLRRQWDAVSEKKLAAAGHNRPRLRASATVDQRGRGPAANQSQFDPIVAVFGGGR